MFAAFANWIAGSITFPLLLNKETGSANAFFVLAAGLNLVAIATWCFMNPNRTSDKTLSPEAIRNRFIAMLTSLILLALGTVGYYIYRSTRKKQATTDQTTQATPNDVVDVNEMTMEEDR